MMVEGLSKTEFLYKNDTYNTLNIVIVYFSLIVSCLT